MKISISVFSATVMLDSIRCSDQKKLYSYSLSIMGCMFFRLRVFACQVRILVCQVSVGVEHVISKSTSAAVRRLLIICKIMKAVKCRRKKIIWISCAGKMLLMYKKVKQRGFWECVFLFHFCLSSL